jgi:predicted DNA-binding protein
MPTKNQRINLALEKPLYRQLQRLAKNDGVSLSLKARDLIKEALEAREDIVLAKFAEEREKTFDKTKALTHEEVW